MQNFGSITQDVAALESLRGAILSIAKGSSHFLSAFGSLLRSQVVLDSNSGSFGLYSLLAVAAGAEHVYTICSSRAALEGTRSVVVRNGTSKYVTLVRTEEDAVQQATRDGRYFDAVLGDPIAICTFSSHRALSALKGAYRLAATRSKKSVALYPSGLNCGFGLTFQPSTFRACCVGASEWARHSRLLNVFDLSPLEEVESAHSARTKVWRVDVARRDVLESAPTHSVHFAESSPSNLCFPFEFTRVSRGTQIDSVCVWASCSFANCVVSTRPLEHGNIAHHGEVHLSPALLFLPPTMRDLVQKTGVMRAQLEFVPCSSEAVGFAWKLTTEDRLSSTYV